MGTLTLGAALLIACDGEDTGAPTPTAGETQAPTADAFEATATAAPDIRQEDLGQHASVVDFIAGAGGTVASDRIAYADLTEDGVDDAVVPISSGGESGDIAVFVLGYGDTGLEELLRVVPQTALRASVEGDILALEEPVYAPGDPMCCPSEVQRTIYQWDGQQLTIAETETVPGQDY